MRKFYLLLVLCGLQGCATATAVPEQRAPDNRKFEPYTLSPAQKAAIENTIRAKLKDPDSAKFTDFKALKGVSPTGAVTYDVCAHVNSKNSYGGYVGPTPFFGSFASGDPERFAALAGPFQDMSGVIYTACRNKGLALF